MKVGILGGTGNISSAIVRRLVAEGHDVYCVNRGTARSSQDGAREIHIDRTDRRRFEELMRREEFEAVVDMISFDAEDAASSVRAFDGVAHLVHCSTVCTYGVDYDHFPVREEHEARPTTGYGSGKAAAEDVLMRAHRESGLPVTIVRPSTTYGPAMGLIRQVAREFSWIDRIRRGMPIVVCGDGKALHQFLHVDDAALGFAGVLGNRETIGQAYNLVRDDFVSWEQYHQVAMRVLGREVDLVGVPLGTLEQVDPARFRICSEIFAHNVVYDAAKIRDAVPEFRPTIGLEQGMEHVIDAMDRDARIPDSRDIRWEDTLIAAQRDVPARVRTEATI